MWETAKNHARGSSDSSDSLNVPNDPKAVTLGTVGGEEGWGAGMKCDLGKVRNAAMTSPPALSSVSIIPPVSRTM